MKRTVWMKLVGFCLVVVTMLAGVAYADPIGPANVPQILLGSSFSGTGSLQLTFLTTDTIAFTADYYDPNPVCAGVAPLVAQFFVFDLEGVVLVGLNAGTGPVTGTAISSKYRALGVALPPGFFPPGSYRFIFLVRSCDNAISVALPEFVTFRVFSP